MLEYWTKPPIDPIIKIYVFNYTNIQDVLNGVDKRIKLKEVGPYVYRERIEKIGVNFEGHSITFNVRHLVIVNLWGNFKLSFGDFQENSSHTFVPHLSHNLTEDDVITVPNIPFISGISTVNSMGFIGQFGFKTILASTKPKEFQNLTVAKYFLGYTDDFMSLVSRVKWDFNPEDVGILSPRRGVTKKSMTIDAGTGADAYNVGRVYAVGGETKLNIWKSEECNQVAGSDGVIYGPRSVQAKDDLQVYLPNFCRALPLVFDREEKISGMRSFVYKAPFGVFSSPENFPANEFFCEPKNAKQKHVDGLLDVSECIDGNPPIFVSHPHFMEGDASLFEHFDGLTPNQQKHESYAYIHPRLSVPLFGVSRTQVNLRLSHFGKYFKNFPDGMVLPLAWIETTTEEFPEHIKTRLFLSTVVVDYLENFLKFGSLLSFLFTSLFLIVNHTHVVKNIAKLVRKILK